jgi:hypothetical protein
MNAMIRGVPGFSKSDRDNLRRILSKVGDCNILPFSQSDCDNARQLLGKLGPARNHNAPRLSGSDLNAIGRGLRDMDEYAEIVDKTEAWLRRVNLDCTPDDFFKAFVNFSRRENGTPGPKPKWESGPGLLLFLTIKARLPRTRGNISRAIREVQSADPEGWGRHYFDSLRSRYNDVRKYVESFIWKVYRVRLDSSE